MSQVNVEQMKARRTELNTGLDTLRAELTKVDETRATLIGHMQQLLGAIQILNELIGPDSETSTSTSDVAES